MLSSPSKGQKKLFGTDGVRGKANLFPMTPEIALALGKAAAVVFRRHEGKHRMVIGKDTRLSCYTFENALIAGLCSMGVDTLLVGPLPTPGVAFMIRSYRADAGIVISASHNAFDDNGIKFFSRDGFKLPSEIEREIEQLVFQSEAMPLPDPHEMGRNSRVFDAYGRYIEFVKSTFPRALSLEELRVVLDCAHGAAYNVAPLIFQELDAKVDAVGVQPDGLNINEQCGSLHPKLAASRLLEVGGDVGIVLDGDADRLIMIDELGQVVDGDVILAICARYLLRKGGLTNQKVVVTVMSNLGMVRGLQELGIEVLFSPVGDRYVIEMMRESGAVLGGEQSGHLVFMEHNTTGDGLVAALQVLKIMVEGRVRLCDLARQVQLYPQVMQNIYVKEKLPIEEWKEMRRAIERAEKKLGDRGRALVRYSGTERLLRIMVESEKARLASAVLEELVAVVKASAIYNEE